MKIKLPKKPVDGYVIRYWVNREGVVSEMRMVYHVLTPWEKFSPNDPGGAEICNEWMCYEAGRSYCSGRVGGWRTPADEDWRGKSTFVREIDALKAAETELVGYIEGNLERIRQAKAKIRALHERAEKL